MTIHLARILVAQYLRLNWLMGRSEGFTAADAAMLRFLDRVATTYGLHMRTVFDLAEVRP